MIQLDPNGTLEMTNSFIDAKKNSGPLGKTMATINDLVSTKRDLLAKFASDFSDKDTSVQAATTEAFALIAAATDAENAEAANLAQLQSQLADLSLTATLTRLTTLQTDAQAKFAAYTTLVQSNNALAEGLFDSLNASQDTISGIYKTVDDLTTNVAAMKVTLAQFVVHAAPVAVAALPAA